MQVEDEYFVPLQDQRVFGAGIKRKRVNFIPAAPPPSAQPTSHTIKAPAERYLSVVFKNFEDTQPRKDNDNKRTVGAIPTNESAQRTICSICHLPVQLSAEISITSRPHEASLAHQVCLTHSHPPSHLDRARPGLKYLSAYGWDPDSRAGLGAASDGILVPIKGKPKNNTVGLGADVEGINNTIPSRSQKLDAGKLRKEAEKEKRKAHRLREMFYRNDDVEKYLGAG
ncbi:hypothetical protein MMC13_000918 [Lambiella insularis]|nr:hypothetical protein [Lambiella insularis]